MEALLYYVIAGAVYFFALAVQRKLKSTYSRWSGVRNQANMTGAQTAQAILQANRMGRVKVGQKPGKLTDHYNPRDKTIGLSEQIYGVPSVAAMAIAAHESGHAIQDEVDYRPLEIRTFLAPIASAGAKFGLPAAIFGSFLGSPLLLQAGVLAYGGALMLQFLTLPVELNASKRAMGQLEKLGLMDDQEKKGVKEVLRAAAMTYVAGAASSAGYIIYIAIIAGRWIFRLPPLAKPPLKPPPLP
ncbi:Putative membrane protease YugP [Olavius algarvensis associated proteobacterium Delta 3]|nr:Putative membrane protease YugP [Olavius algarvensis associated proteobacterium Delta 3]